MLQIFVLQAPEVFKNFFEIFGVKHMLDILIVSSLIYLAILLFKRTHSYAILGGIVFLFLIYLVAHFFNFFLTVLILKYFFTFFILILAVVFQKELRNFFELIFVLGFFRRKTPKTLSEHTSSEITDSLKYLSEKKIGALIVLHGVQPLGRLLEGGFVLGGQVSKPLLLSLFDPSSPGHDGAVVIEGDQLQQFGVHLPLAEKFQQYRELGTRHRSALGLSQRSDALVLIVSEERGTISVAHHGELHQVESADALREEIKDFIAEEETVSRPWYQWFIQNSAEKIIALISATILWVVFAIQSGLLH